MPPLSAILAEQERREAERQREHVARNAEAIRERCQTLAGFVREAWHVLEPTATYVHNWHIDVVCEHLEAVTNGDITRLLINIPPGSMKSLLVSVFWPSWEWGPRGLKSLRYIATSFNEDSVKRDTRKCRDLIGSEWYRALWPDVELTRSGELSFANSATGVRDGVPFGSLTGKRADRLLIDDPHSIKTVESDAQRHETTRLFRERAIMSLNDMERSAIVIVMQRLHEEDISGIVQTYNMPFEHVCLPMEFEPHRRYVTILGAVDPRTEEGELLDPIRVPRATLEQMRNDMTSFAWAGQFQQRPNPRGGGIIQMEGWEFWDKNVAIKYGRNENQFPDLEYVILSADTAYGLKQENDYSAWVVLGIWQDIHNRPKVIVMTAGQDRLKINDLANKLITLGRKYKIDRMLIEAKASGMSVAQEVRRLQGEEKWAVNVVNPGAQDKVARAHSITPLMGEVLEDGRRRDGIVFVPCVTPEGGEPYPRVWADLLMSVCASFPRGAHDDLVDAFVQGMRHLRDCGLARRSDEMIAEIERAKIHIGAPPEPLYPV